MSKYFTLGTFADGMAMLQEEYDKYYKKHSLKCGHVPFKKANKKITVSVKTLDLSLAYNFAGLLTINVFLRNDLFEVLEPYLSAEYDFGQIKFNGKTVKEGVLLWQRREAIPIRAYKEALCWRCNHCGVLRYDPFPWKRRSMYLLKKDVDGMLIGPAGLTTVVHEKIVELLTSHPQWNVFKKKTEIKEIAVLNEPKDGFPMNLEDILPKDERRPPKG